MKIVDVTVLQHVKEVALRRPLNHGGHRGHRERLEGEAFDAISEVKRVEID